LKRLSSLTETTGKIVLKKTINLKDRGKVLPTNPNETQTEKNSSKKLESSATMDTREGKEPPNSENSEEDFRGTP